MPPFVFVITKDVFFVDFKFLLIFTFGNHRTIAKEPFASTAYNALVGTLISTGDFIDIFAYRETFGSWNRKSPLSKTLWVWVSRENVLCARHLVIKLIELCQFKVHGPCPIEIIHSFGLLKGEFPQQRFRCANEFVKRYLLEDKYRVHVIWFVLRSCKSNPAIVHLFLLRIWITGEY